MEKKRTAGEVGSVHDSVIGRPVEIIIDRPLGSRHPNHPDIVYPLNYGYVDGILAGDGEMQDVYLLGVNRPVERFTGEVIAVIRRLDDVEDKWVAAPAGVSFTREEIVEKTLFQEQYFRTQLYLRPHIQDNSQVR